MNNKTSITALISSFGRAFHAENEDHPVFTDHLARELMTTEEYTAVQNYILSGAQFFEPEIVPEKQEPKELLQRLVNVPDDIQRNVIHKAGADMKAFEHVNYCLAVRKN